MFMLFNEIVENGFDSHNFINGLSSHYRNLLVCKNPKSADLLEVLMESKTSILNRLMR